MQLVHHVNDAFDADGRSRCGQRIFAKESNQSVIPSAAGERTDFGFSDDGFKNGAGVIFQPAHHRQIHLQARGLYAQRARVTEQLFQLGDALYAARIRAQCFAPRVQVVNGQGDQRENFFHRRVGNFIRNHFLAHALAADFFQFINGAIQTAEQGRGDAGILAQRGQDLAMVEFGHKRVKAEFAQNRKNHGNDFGVGEHGGRADNIGVALKKFAVATFLRSFRAPYRRDLITLERFGHFGIHGDDARQWHGQIVSQRELFFAFAVARVVNQFFRVRTVLARQSLREFQRGRLQRLETEPFKNIFNDAHHITPPQHFLRHNIAHSARQTGFDKRRHAIPPEIIGRHPTMRRRESTRRRRPSRGP
ncbi:MAG: hypothetical protein HDKAJFGB_04120 [Anaerolineae bacterium]|nr:hypothetical protein [Anaerolineae bacterium]